MNKSIEQSVKQKLKNLSKDTKVPFNSLLDSLFLERFLVRISASSYAEQLIFKGGMCLAQIIDLGRETKDIDFLLVQMKGSLLSIQTMMDNIANVEIHDGFTFSEVTVSELSLVHKKYPGYRIAIQGHLGQIRNKVTIDIGVGDVVKSINLKVVLLGKQSPIFERNVDLRAYPAEYIFSEKLEAIIHLDELNSRMKDFYDCYRMIQDDALDEQKLQEALVSTFANRGTHLGSIPDLADILEKRWLGFLRKNGMELISLDQVITIINSKTFKMQHKSN